MRIGIDASATFGWRGPSRSVKNLIRSLLKIDKENEYFIFVPRDPLPQLEFSGNYKWIVARKRRFVPWLSLTLPLAARKRKLDVFLFPQPDFWLLKPTRTIVITRAASIEPFLKGRVEKINAAFKKNRFRKVADKVVCVSHSNATLIRFSCGIEKEKMDVIYNAVDPHFLSGGISRGLGAGKYILYVGGTEEDKNIVRLLEAYKILVSKGNDADNVLVIVGDIYMGFGTHTDTLKQIVERLGLEDKVIFKGAVKDTMELANIYSGATSLVFPSLLESFGLVPLEAMACGCPVVSSNAAAMPEVLGDAAEYFDPYSVEEMAEKIEKVLRDEILRETLRARGKERVKRYNWERSAQRLLSVIGEVVKKS
jgi:glycosyltransferase involved in cell wall biosynthesis